MTTMKHLFLAIAFAPFALFAQERYGTRTGTITFFSETPAENIEAVNRKVSSVWDVSTGAIQFAALIKAFEFEKALMQEHFNENYMESNTYPKADFKGTVSGVSAEQLKKPGTYDVTVEGDLTIHGVTRKVSHPGKITVNENGSVKAVSRFIVKPEDHGIKVPAVVRKNIAEEIAVSVDLDLAKL
jgi:hypothetical protein